MGVLCSLGCLEVLIQACSWIAFVKMDYISLFKLLCCCLASFIISFQKKFIFVQCWVSWWALELCVCERETDRTQATSSALSVAMVKMKFKMQSYNEIPDWLWSHARDCDAFCQLANEMQVEQELLLRGVVWNRVSWVLSLTHSLSHAAGSPFALIDLSPPPSFPHVFFFFPFNTCKRGKSTCWKIHWIFHAAFCAGLSHIKRKLHPQSGLLNLHPNVWAGFYFYFLVCAVSDIYLHYFYSHCLYSSSPVSVSSVFCVFV